MRLARPLLGTVTSVRRARADSGEPLILSQGAGAYFMAGEQCAKKMNRVEVGKERLSTRVEDLGLLSTSGQLAVGF